MSFYYFFLLLQFLYFVYSNFVEIICFVRIWFTNTIFSTMTSSESRKSRHGRTLTRFLDVTSPWITMKRLTAEIDPWSGTPKGPHKEKFRSYLGILAKMHVCIAIASWDDVPKMEKNLPWHDILVCWLKTYTLSNMFYFNH